ncbi:glucose transporter type 1-like [Tigriopus californicus]|nr:glucose transporter type 1-like [Tigriopus californicus]
MACSGISGPLALAIFSAVLGMFQFGFNTGVINSPGVHIKAFINETGDGEYSEAKVETLFSLAVSACLVGGMIGGLSGGWLADKFGRRQGLWYTQVFTIVGSILMGFCEMAGSYAMLFIGRFSIGISCGLFTGLAPLYISEVAPIDIRGGLGVVNQLAVTTGIFFSQVLGLEVVLGSRTLWPLLLALGGAVPSILQVILLPLNPESPRYLIITKGQEEAGRKALAKFSKSANPEAEFEEIRSSMDVGNQEKMSVIQLLKSKECRLPLLICVLMHLSQQLSGMVAIFYYSTTFFIGAGVEKERAQYATLGVGAIMMIMTLVTLPLMDRLGRRFLHLTGLGGIFICAILITIGQNLDREQEWVGYFIIFSTLLFVVFFAFGPGSIPWLITGEMFLQAPRPSAFAVATLVNWLANLGVGLLFPLMEQEISSYSFLPFAVITGILYVTLYVYLPETKGRSVEEISTLLTLPGAWLGSYNKRESAVKL